MQYGLRIMLAIYNTAYAFLAQVNRSYGVRTYLYRRDMSH